PLRRVLLDAFTADERDPAGVVRRRVRADLPPRPRPESTPPACARAQNTRARREPRDRMIRLATTAVLLCLALPVRGAIPGFAVQVRGEPLRQYLPTPGAPDVVDDAVKASVRSVGDREWELRLALKRGPVTAVWFPWEGESDTVTVDAHDVVYYPHLF